mmetsp:Transcript_15565/g.39061  ORF Transcript_15565/g.39061 Transcript_15565/m.39061 type:complete len:584 (+) Transcript_15565:459-2210(+)
MFIPNIQQLCDEEQLARWLPEALSWRMIGCYAQTELGHGSNIRALETTATYIPETQEFEINTPTLTATKFWPGTLGRSANTAMVIAQLIVDGERLGIHNFIVPIRDRSTHLPLPGIHAGDIGPKLGFNNMDNGYLVLDKVRVPRSNMAARYAYVNEEGQYVRRTTAAGADKVAYITMMQVRAFIIKDAGRKLAQACTIGVRYSVVRRQGRANDSSKETQILDYSTQAHRLITLVATAYCWYFTGEAAIKVLRDLEAKLRCGDPDVATQMKAAHASFSGLKALTSGITADGMEDIRRACGGHGYLMASGLPELLQVYVQNCTVEGDNYMLPQQVMRILLKELEGTRSGRPPSGGCSYFARASSLLGSVCSAHTGEELRSCAALLHAYEHRAVRLVFHVAQCLQDAVEEGKPAATAWNETLVEIGRASRAHSMLIALKAFADALESNVIVPKNRKVLSLMFSLFGLFWMERDMADFVEDGYLDSTQAIHVRKQVLALIGELRSDAVALVDAWDISDFCLKSTIGRFDGDIYPALLADAQQSTLNATDPVQGWYEHGRPLESGEVAKKFEGLETALKTQQRTVSRL